MRLFKKKESFKKSFAQSGEDLLVDMLLPHLNPLKLSYLDIGAHHPTHINNTYLLYERGLKGCCIEPDPILFKTIKEKRTKDLCLNVGIGVNTESKADFFIMSDRTYNTFSKEEAIQMQKECNVTIENTISIDLIDINNIFEQYFEPYPNFISLDIEGLDFEVLKTINFAKYRPEVFCIETLNHSHDRRKQVKNTDLINYMLDKDYFVFADTYINTIFVSNNFWFNGIIA